MLASDGVWEFISSQEAIDIVNRSLEEGTMKVRRVADDPLRSNPLLSPAILPLLEPEPSRKARNTYRFVGGRARRKTEQHVRFRKTYVNA